MKIGQIYQANILLESKQAIEALAEKLSKREPSFLENGRPAPIGRLELNEGQLKKLQDAMRETVKAFFDEEISGILDKLEALGVETGRGK